MIHIQEHQEFSLKIMGLLFFKDWLGNMDYLIPC